jgi:signal transduction histidine kinase
MSEEAAGRPADDPQEAVGTELVSHCRHAIRTPLNAILGFAQILTLDREQPLSAIQRERLEQIQAAGWQLLQMIDDALELARIAGMTERIGGRLQVRDDPGSGSQLRLVMRETR